MQLDPILLKILCLIFCEISEYLGNTVVGVERVSLKYRYRNVKGFQLARVKALLFGSISLAYYFLARPEFVLC